MIDIYIFLVNSYLLIFSEYFSYDSDETFFLNLNYHLNTFSEVAWKYYRPCEYCRKKTFPFQNVMKTN